MISKVVFLDRDGVINEYPGERSYVTCWQEFKFIPGSIEAMRKFNEKGFRLFVVSNQAGVSKGLYSKKKLDEINRKMLKILKKNGASLDGIYYCPHRDEENCLCRKPKTGLLSEALSRANLTPRVSFFIGDSFRDMRAAKDFGAKSVLLLSGREKIANRKNWEFEPDYVFDNLLLASHYLTK